MVTFNTLAYLIYSFTIWDITWGLDIPEYEQEQRWIILCIFAVTIIASLGIAIPNEDKAKDTNYDWGKD